jgi:hypothetical protein
LFKLLASEASAVVHRSPIIIGGKSASRQASPTPTEDQLSQLEYKKEVFQKELEACINAKHLQMNMDELLRKRQRLFEEQTALMEEKKKIREDLIEKGEDPDIEGPNSPYYMTDRLDSLADEIKYFNNKIKQLQSEITDLDNFSESHENEFGYSAHTDNIMHLIRTMHNPFDLSKMCQFLVEELIESRTMSKLCQDNLYKQRQTTQDLRKTLQVVKESNVRQAMEYERRLTDLRVPELHRSTTTHAPQPTVEVEMGNRSAAQVKVDNEPSCLQLSSSTDKETKPVSPLSGNGPKVCTIVRGGTLTLSENRPFTSENCSKGVSHSADNPSKKRQYGRTTPTVNSSYSASTSPTNTSQASNPQSHQSIHPTSAYSSIHSFPAANLQAKDVFERLSSLHTQASQAKVIHRNAVHSIPSEEIPNP